MVAGPEISRITTEFEQQDTSNNMMLVAPGIITMTSNLEFKQHSLKRVNVLVTVLEEMGNPILEHSHDLLVIDTWDIMNTQFAQAVRRIKTLGEEQYTTFMK